MHPTLAEFLTSRGYLTAGFAANTYWLSYESGMDRGFVHYEDYPFSLGAMLGSTMPGRWLLSNLRSPWDYHGVKWVRAQSRDARGINASFLNWLSMNRSRGPAVLRVFELSRRPRAVSASGRRRSTLWPAPRIAQRLHDAA